VCELATVLLWQSFEEVISMNFYYSLNDAEAKPQYLGNFNSHHHAETEIRKLLNASCARFGDAYLFLHKSALPWQDQDVEYLGPFRLVRIVSNRPPRRRGSMYLFSGDLFDESTTMLPTEARGQLAKAS
jgi:hypothetical protein